MKVKLNLVKVGKGKGKGKDIYSIFRWGVESQVALFVEHFFGRVCSYVLY
jgi:hypothetical protein